MAAYSTLAIDAVALNHQAIHSAQGIVIIFLAFSRRNIADMRNTIRK